MSSSMSETFANAGPARPAGERVIYRHSLLVRVTHWINALCFVLLLMSGLQIFNAHPALYWGAQSTFDRPLLALTARQEGDDSIKGVTTILGKSFATTGVLGASRDEKRTARRTRLSKLDHHSFLSRSGDGPALAFLFRLAAGAERRGLCRQSVRAPAFEGLRAFADANCARYPASIWEHAAAALSQGRRSACIITCCRSSPISPSSSRCRSWYWRA